ncbi:MAG: aminoglycoside phosphotransferase family protein [Oscillospiraceae bacterium]|nr:aminoglycoside phosphotransferase family protein [Oscillospiraceae bacterium]
MKTVLSEAKQVYRIGDVVQRPAHPWSPTVGRLLQHFAGENLPVERIISLDEQHECAEFFQGEMVHPQKWTDDALFEIGQLIAKLHAAAPRFAQRDDDIWQTWYLREIGRADNRIICHGDLAPWNLLTENGRPKLLVDWEFAGPLDPLVELARVCWLFAQLHDDDLQVIHDLPPLEKRAEQVRIICDGYGLPAQARARLIDQIIEVIICETAHEAIDPALTFDSTGSLWGFAWRTRSLYWIWRNQAVLRNALI